MKFLFTFLACTLAAALTACVTPVADEGGIGVKIGPVASLERVQAGEASAKEYADKVSDAMAKLANGQATLAEALGLAKEAEEARAAAAVVLAAKLQSDVDTAIAKAKDDVAIDWTQIILAGLGMGTVGAGGTAGVLGYRRKLLNTVPAGADDGWEYEEA